MYSDFLRGVQTQIPGSPIIPITDKAFYKFLKRPVSPKVKETRFKIIQKIYPAAEFLKRRFEFEVDPCIFCNENEETLEHV